MNQQPEFDTLEEFFEHHRGLLDLQAVEIAARATAEAQDAGFNVDTATEQLMAQRIRAMLLQKLEETYHRLKGKP
jgi:hypothetical protein